MKHNQKIGKWGEQAACEYLQQRGYTILERNIRTPFGEIDIVAKLEAVVVFVEVKARTSRSYGLPEEALTKRKLAHMLACARHYAAENDVETWECDAISVEGIPGLTAQIEHFENVTE